MCLIDWRLGRLVTPVFHGEINANAFTLPANRQRVAVMLVAATPNNILDTQCIISIDDNQFDFLSPNHPVGLYSLTTHGDIPTRRFSANDAQDGTNLLVTEFFMPEKYLNTLLEEFMRSIK